ncbi:MAG: hypothetical protein IJN05_08340 [Ruminococcus sp.]|nr:hypothetical protein [Oscillospiraceae bacterium]MBQ7009205.1 hypothetical protein [Ruminococcus sp.]
MAEKRMFDKRFMESDAFLELSPSSQMLYVHLSLNADDDGFLCNYKGIMRLVSCTEEDFNALLEHGFIIRFKSGVIVISHWKINNNIRQDRYKPTNCKEKTMIYLSETDKTYHLNDDKKSRFPFGIPTDNQTEPE